MENGKHKTNSFNSFNSWSKKQSLLPSLQGGAGGRLSPNQARSATNQASLRAANQVRSAANPQKRCFKCFKCFRCFKCSTKGKGFRFSFRFRSSWCFRCFTQRGNPNQARRAANQASLRAANQVRSTTNRAKRLTEQSG